MATGGITLREDFVIFKDHIKDLYTPSLGSSTRRIFGIYIFYVRCDRESVLEIFLPMSPNCTIWML